MKKIEELAKRIIEDDKHIQSLEDVKYLFRVSGTWLKTENTEEIHSYYDLFKMLCGRIDEGLRIHKKELKYKLMKELKKNK